MVDVGGGRSVVVALTENAIPNLILFSFLFSTHSHFPSLSLVFVAVVPRGGGRRSFFGGGGRRWYRPFGGSRADASFAHAAPVPSHFQESVVGECWKGSQLEQSSTLVSKFPLRALFSNR
ncbi:hypothetical protein DEO72_LG7g854 [Vigna unguiculata]|uniref:Uncharacterized protein n=1 Tax=Vigna unguiculata TaxID=3917 RepID=A0A4D6MGE4_VIGUN|nr:hypothetical protein DEO72_LG7g854 [Vigna unguiculata]